MDNLNISLWGGLTWLCYALIVGFLLRTAASLWPDNPVSKALLFIS